jgi:hypothetical protein
MIMQELFVTVFTVYYTGMYMKRGLPFPVLIAA